MSLRVWLPLNGNLNNQGLTDITVTNNGATVDNSGKIGKCYSFGTSTSYLTLSSEPMQSCTTECSLSFWLNIISWNASYATYFQAGLGGAPWTHYIFGVLRNAGGTNLCFTISNGSSSSQASYTTPALSLNTWYHLTFVYKTGHCLIYINGELHKDYATTIVPNFSGITKTTVGVCNSGGYQTNCKMNDVRVYDHALSPREVKLLSRGLVAHYPLNGNGRGGDNIMPNSYVMNLGTSSAANGVWRLAGTNNMTRSRIQTESGYYAFQNSGIQTANDGSCYGIDSFTFKANTTYTMSMSARMISGTEGYAGFALYSVTIIGGTHTKVDKNYYVTPLTTSWKRIYITFTTNSSTSRNIYIGITTGSTNVTTQMALVKIEEGDKCTPWIPKSTDSAYTKMGYDSTTEYDVSGNGYNGTKSKTMLYTSNTARYSVATIFDGNTDSIKIPFNQMLGLNSATKTDYTVSVWTYKSVIGGKSYQTILGGQSGFELEARNSTNANPVFKLYSWGGGETPYEFNKWYHVCFVHTTTDSKLYINGELKITGTSVVVPIGNFYIGSWKFTNSQNFEGKMSDFRIYATALSEDDVAELYNTAVSVANNGTLMGYELVEV